MKETRELHVVEGPENGLTVLVDKAQKYHPVIARSANTNNDILVNIPLFNPEDLIVKERYRVSDVNPNLAGSYRFYLVKNRPQNDFDIEAKFTDKDMAQDYCDYLNSKETNVDVEKLAEEKYPLYVSEQLVKSGYNAHRSNERKAFIAGYNTAPKGGYSREDMEALIDFWRREIPNPWANHERLTKKYNEDVISTKNLVNEYLASLKQPLTVKVEFENGSPVIENGFVKIVK